MTARRGGPRRPANRLTPAEPELSILSSLPPVDPAWQLEAHGFEPNAEPSNESRFSISNGHLGVRGALEIPATASRARTYIAGLFHTPARDPAVPKLVTAPNWLRLELSVDGEAISLDDDRTLDVKRVLDFRGGLLRTELLHRTAAGHVVRLRAARLASLADRHLGLEITEIQVDPRPGRRSARVEARVVPPGVRPSPQPSPTAVGEGVRRATCFWQTEVGDEALAIAEDVSLHGQASARIRQLRGADGAPAWTWQAAAGRTMALARTVSFARGPRAEEPSPQPSPTAGGEGAEAARAALLRARRRGVATLLREHRRRWEERWAAGDIEIDGDATAQRALRFGIYHMISAANPENDRVSIGARGLTGDAYAGHVFWDTEIFLLPFYTLTWPEAARALLMYRYRTLPAAREKAAAHGYRGAFYPWESADGHEATPPYIRGKNRAAILIANAGQEQHISADIAYAVWQYWQATGNDAFFLEAGAEIILETARFWASRAEPGMDGRFHIRQVIGPDEYHDGVDDNAYTNGMAQWNLECAMATAQWLRDRWPERWRELRDRLQLVEEEEQLWRGVAEGLDIRWDTDTGLIEQFAGFFDLEHIDVPPAAERRVAMDVLVGADRIRGLQVLKQADALMLLALRPDGFPRAVQAANFSYYAPRCGQGSSLSTAIHALVAARLGEMDAAESYFRDTAAIDLDDTMGNASEGVHMAALGGLWQTVVFGFAGVSLRPFGLELAPHLPAAWRSVRFRLQWRGRQVRFQLDGQTRKVTITLERGDSMVVRVGPAEHRLDPGEAWTCGWPTTSPWSRAP